MSKNGNHVSWDIVKWSAPACPDSVSTEADHRVALLGRQEDFECILLAKFGMTAKTIQRFTGLRQGQVTYRLKKGQVRISDFRNGKGQYAEMVFHGMAKMAAARLTHELRQLEQHGRA